MYKTKSETNEMRKLRWKAPINILMAQRKFRQPMEEKRSPRRKKKKKEKSKTQESTREQPKKEEEVIHKSLGKMLADFAKTNATMEQLESFTASTKRITEL